MFGRYSAPPRRRFRLKNPHLALLAMIAGVWLPTGASAEQASQPESTAAAELDAGRDHSCAVLTGGTVRCWGHGAHGQLGYGNTRTIGDDEAPASVGPVFLGPGRSAKAISAGGVHSCALLDDGSVRCW
ncbi:MAG: RCC1 domain-containing protein, partial [Actinomycetota bacterium]|nr:RCC1 domain-containing protein [Actinomycetota bacterium]